MTMQCPEELKFTGPKRKPKVTPWLRAPAPEQFETPNLAFDNPGFAEIKPHNSQGLTDGWKDLSKKSKLSDKTRRGRTPKFLVTYLPVKEGKTGRDINDAVKDSTPPCVRVFASPYTGEPERPHVSKMKFHNLGSFKPPPTVPLNVEEASLFGAAIEKYARELFQREILDRLKPQKQGHGGTTVHGADIYWDELARFYAELARELGDPFYADLASELASLSREATMWDAA